MHGYPDMHTMYQGHDGTDHKTFTFKGVHSTLTMNSGVVSVESASLIYFNSGCGIPWDRLPPVSTIPEWDPRVGSQSGIDCCRYDLDGLKNIRANGWIEQGIGCSSHENDLHGIWSSCMFVE